MSRPLEGKPKPEALGAGLARHWDVTREHRVLRAGHLCAQGPNHLLQKRGHMVGKLGLDSGRPTAQELGQLRLEEHRQASALTAAQ